MYIKTNTLKTNRMMKTEYTMKSKFGTGSFLGLVHTEWRVDYMWMAEFTLHVLYHPCRRYITKANYGDTKSICMKQIIPRRLQGIVAL